jgi:UDP-N-acetylmuramoyl-L-alanyl-D-glutamate--2,6-diaminopimelate ligase
MVARLHTEELLAQLPAATPLGDLPAEVGLVVCDSRRVGRGDVFVAIQGLREDGHAYIAQARERGAALVVGERLDALSGGPSLLVPDSRRALGLLAAAACGHPSKHLRMIGVTGTNGKTSTTHLLASILEASGTPTAVIGTIGVYLGGERQDLARTTPDPGDLQPLLAHLLGRGARAVVMEVSSHALALDRVVGCEFDGAVFTNLTQDHLDFHRTIERYRSAKLRLFTSLGGSYTGAPKAGRKWAAINVGDPSGPLFMRRTPVRTVTFGPGGEVQAEAVECDRDGSRFVLRGPFGLRPVRLRPPGRFYALNALAAAAAAWAEGVSVDAIVAGLEAVRGVPGRFEAVTGPWPFLVLVDYAHTPDGMEKLLTAAREVTPGRVFLLTGAGGDRDRGKRAPMGEAAARGADFVALTADNPRSEDPERIMDQLEEGVVRARKRPLVRDVDRRRAIEAVMRQARAGDTVVLAGKGHETYQIIGDHVFPFDDRVMAREVLEEMGPW